MNLNSPQKAIDNLIAGYQEFKKKDIEQSDAYVELAKGQSPKVLVIACSDSRIEPAIVTGCEPGDLFVVRNVANLVTPFDSDPRHQGTSAALEFGVKGLQVEHIIIFGHSSCGGIKALMTSAGGEDSLAFVDGWMEAAKPAKKNVLQKHEGESLDKQVHACEKESLLMSLKNLSEYPWIKDRVEQGSLQLHAWYFDLAEGAVKAYHPENKQFMAL